MSASVSWDALCRLCLTSRSRLLPIFGGTEPADLADKIQACVSVMVKEDDELPTRVCSKCLDNVNNWHIFKRVCEKSQAKLEGMTKEGVQLEHPLKIKSEPLTDETYDEGVVIDGIYPEYDENDAVSKIQPEGPPILASLGLAPRSEKNVVDPRLDWPRVEAILNLVQDDDVIDSLQSAEELDNVQYSEHESDSEGDLLTDVEDEYLDSKDGYITRDRRMLSRMPKISPGHVLKKFKSVHLKRSNTAQNSHTPQPKQAWRVFFTMDMLEYIVECTNDHILAVSGIDHLTSVNELEAVIGILYLHGVSRAFYHHRSEMWMRGISIDGVVKAMPEERFMFVLQNLRFEKETLMSDDQYDLLKPIRTIFERFALNCRTSYEVGSHVVVDEKVEVIFGPCPFRTQFVNKPQHCGVKFIILVDPTSFYVSNLDLTTDRNVVSATECVKKLVEHLAESGKTVVMDSWFTSLDLITSLLNDYGLYSIAALKPSDWLIPPFFISQHRNVGTFMTAFVDSDVSLTSFVTPERKVINVLSSNPKHYKRSSIDNRTAVSQYKQYQSAGEVVNVLTRYYTTAQHTNSWALSLFFTLLDIACINAQVLWLSGRGNSVVRRNLFIRTVALGLLEDHQDGSNNCPVDFASTSTPKRLKYLHLVSSGKSRNRCQLCKGRKNRRTKVKCVNCDVAICREHTTMWCIHCAPRPAEK